MTYLRGKIAIDTEEEVIFRANELQELEHLTNGATIDDKPTIALRSGGIFASKGYWLNEEFDWIIVKDDQGNLVLVPTVKQKEVVK